MKADSLEQPVVADDDDDISDPAAVAGGEMHAASAEGVRLSRAWMQALRWDNNLRRGVNTGIQLYVVINDRKLCA